MTTDQTPSTELSPDVAGDAAMNEWNEAMAEQSKVTAQTTSAPAAAPKPVDPSTMFRNLDAAPPKADTMDINVLRDIPVELSVQLGRARMPIRDLLQLGPGSVVELSGLAGEPLDIFVNGYLLAQGEVVVVEEKYGVRLTDIITASERLARLAGKA